MVQSPLLPNLHGYIDGAWTPADSGECFSVSNPVNGDELTRVSSLGTDETRRAIDAAQAALRAGSSLEERQAWLDSIVDTLKAHKKEVGRILTLEHGKPLKEAEGEVLYAAGFFEYCARNLYSLGPRTLHERPKDATWTVYNRPAGVVGLVTPWNFPIGMIAKKLSAAIAAGCPSVIKPSSKTPLTMIALFTLMDREVDLPPGFVNLVTGPSGPIGDTLMEDDRVRVVSFTGSTEVGRKLIKASAPGVKKLTLELGGNAPFIVFADTDLDKAADHLIANKFRGGGQTCVCANRILVEASAEEAFAEKVATRAAKLKVGDGMEPDTDLGPLIDRNGYEKVRRHFNDAVENGATVVLGEDPGEIHDDWGGFFPPAVLRGVQPGMDCTCEETFGPLVPITPFRDEDHALELANDTEFGLAAYLFTQNEARAQRIIPALEFAHVGHNTGTGPTPEAPFGGMKSSGWGREGGTEGLFEFVEPQTVPRGD